MLKNQTIILFKYIFSWLAVLMLTTGSSIAQQPGTLDSSFGDNGVFYHQLQVYGVKKSKIQPDDKLLGLAGGMGVYRFNKDGEVDSSFGKDGYTRVSFDDIEGVLGSTSADLLIQPDGKIILVGYIVFLIRDPGINTIMARLKPDGSLDSTFGDNGRVVDRSNPTFTDDFPEAAALQQDGKIVITGNRNINQDAPGFLKRYLPDGGKDNSFGEKGTVLTKGNFYLLSVLVQPDGKIVAGGGDAAKPLDYTFSVLRFNSDGSPDKSFGKEGVSITAFEGRNEYAYSIVLQQDGKIVAAGVSKDYLTIRYSLMAVARYNTDGSLDETFGSKGKQTIAFDTYKSKAVKVLWQPDYKIVLAGWAYDDFRTPAVWNNAVVRLHDNGSLDSAFGDNGKNVTVLPIGVLCSDAGFQSDGKLLLAGSTDSSPSGIVFNRYYCYDAKKPLGPIAKKIRRWIRNHTLQWQPLNENSISYYSIQQSSNGVNGFKEIGRITNVNRQSSNVNNVYSYNLNNASSSNIQHSTSNISYYRISAVSNSGSNITSDVIADENISAITVAPNPVKDVLKISGLPANQKSTVNIINRNGNILQSAICNSSVCNMNVSQLKSGLYNLQIISNSKTQTLKFVKE